MVEFNRILEKSLIDSDGKAVQLPKPWKTGTTICGIIFKDGVILGADTRSTAGSIVANKNCQKIHFISKNIYCCGAGTAADTDYVTRMVSSDLELHCLEADEEVAPIIMARTIMKRYLFQYQGHVGAALILGGYDKSGPFLGSISPHGNTDVVPFITMGSGSLAAMSVFETRFRENLSEEDGKRLVRDAITAGVLNDLGSGSNVDLCIIKKDKVDYIRPYDVPVSRAARLASYKYPKGSTAVLKSVRIPIEVVSETVERDEPMEE